MTCRGFIEQRMQSIVGAWVAEAHHRKGSELEGRVPALAERLAGVVEEEVSFHGGALEEGLDDLLESELVDEDSTALAQLPALIVAELRARAVAVFAVDCAKGVLLLRAARPALQTPVGTCRFAARVLAGEGLLVERRADAWDPMESHRAGLAVGTRVCLRGRVLGVLCVTLDRDAFDAADRERLRRLAHGSALLLAAQDRIRALGEARDALVEEQADKARFVVRATQDLRDPLTVAKLGCQFFARIGKDSELVPHLVLRIARSVERMERMIDDLSAAAMVAAEGDRFGEDGPRLRLVPGESDEDSPS